ncbi:MAG: acyl carrier protein [Candidatus Onthomorpha sp.]
MNNNEILAKLQEIFCDILDNEDILISFESCADDIEEWDSLTHVQLVSEIQKEFNIKFTAKEMISWDNVGDMCNTIQSKI